MQTLKQKQLQIDHWQDKESTRSEVQTVIHDYLYNDDTGLPIDSYTEEEVKKAYRKLAMRFHPDRLNDLSESEKKQAEEKFHRVQAAYENIKKKNGW